MPERTKRSPQDEGLDAPLPIVSVDTHIGPRLVEDLRPYCSAQLIESFDAFVEEASRDATRVKRYAPDDDSPEARADRESRRNLRTAGHYDMAARRADLDGDGVACEVIFHGSQNGQPIPFEPGAGIRFHEAHPTDVEMVAAGRHIYNRWLADAVASDPTRHVGVAQIPSWDIDASVAEIDWAYSAGLRGVNLPTPRPGMVELNRPEWEPFWTLCEERGIPLLTHAGGAALHARFTGPEAYALFSIEGGGWLSRRAMHWMIFGGVFERHPDLKLVLVEQPGCWWSAAMNEMDSAYLLNRKALGHLKRMPSEYAMTNVFIGASFLAAFEVEDAITQGYASRVMWGSDYPHREGTFQHGQTYGGENVAILALRSTFACADEVSTRAILGDTATDVFGLDAEALRATARRIEAPTMRQLRVPITEAPDNGGTLAFRTMGAWA